MQSDIFGQPTSLTTPVAIEAWNETMMGFLAHAAATPRHLATVLGEAPNFAMGYAVKGLFYLLLGRRELLETARETMDAAWVAKRRIGVDQREGLYVDALAAWMAGQPNGSIAAMEQVLDLYPQDTLAMKLSQAIRFVLGDTDGMRRSVERVLPTYQPNHAGRGYLLGCYAFALEETGDYDRAGIAGRQALWLAPNDAWGLHAVAHVHDMTCNARAGLDWLAGREAAWAHCNNFRHHVWWHKALMHLDLCQIDEVIALYDTEIRKDKTDDYRDISNATSLLVRLELDGVDVGDRWEELADLSADRTEDGCLIFADLHYLMALSADNRDVATHRMLQRLHRDGQTRTDEAGQRMAKPGIPAAEGLAAFGEGRYGAAFHALSQARRDLYLAGGSHAQRDVFERLAIDAGIRAGLLDGAEAILDARRATRAGREDGYAEARRNLIAAGRGTTPAHSVPAQ